MERQHFVLVHDFPMHLIIYTMMCIGQCLENSILVLVNQMNVDIGSFCSFCLSCTKTKRKKVKKKKGSRKCYGVAKFLCL